MLIDIIFIETLLNIAPQQSSSLYALEYIYNYYSLRHLVELMYACNS